MSIELIVFFVLYGLTQMFGLAFTIAAFEGHEELRADFALPYRMYRSSKMNWFGAWACSILVFLLIPVSYILQVFWWLFHIGKK